MTPFLKMCVVAAAPSQEHHAPLCHARANLPWLPPSDQCSSSATHEAEESTRSMRRRSAMDASESGS